MKPSKQIPTRLKIDVLIVIVGMGLIALGIVTTTARILGTSVQEYARLNSVLVAGWFAGAAAAMALFEPDREDYRSGAH
jgi:ABC-type uncharacterized transport system permease subunit